MRSTRSRCVLAIVFAVTVAATCTSTAQTQKEDQQKADKPNTIVAMEALLQAQGESTSDATNRALRYLCWSGAARVVGTHSLGVTVVPADATLRAQLALPADEGLIVTNVDPNSSASEAGIAQHDLLLRLDDKPLAGPDDLNKQVDAVGDKPVGLDAIRNGKRIKLQVTPKRVYRVAMMHDFGNEKTQTRIRIGVELAAAEETLRAQLKLPDGQGVVVTNVIDDLPAAKAGIQKHDILLMLGDKPVASSEGFREKLQEVGENPVAIRLVREAKTISIEVTPQKHEEPKWLTTRLDLAEDVQWRHIFEVVRPAVIDPIEANRLYHVGQFVRPKVEATADPQARLQELIAQVKDLQNALEALGDDLKKPQPAADPAEKK